MQRVKELDSIRGLAAVTIVIYHVWFIKIGLLGAPSICSSCCRAT